MLNDQGGDSISGIDNARVAPTIRAEMHGNIPAVAYDARGNGDGKTTPTITGDHENRITDYTSVVVNGYYRLESFGDYSESRAASALKQRDYKDSTDLVVESEAGKPHYLVRRLTPLECERLQGYPETLEVIAEEITKDEYIAVNLATGQIIADCETGKIYTTKGPGGIKLSAPKELNGTILNGYRVVSIRNGSIKNNVVFTESYGLQNTVCLQ